MCPVLWKQLNCAAFDINFGRGVWIGDVGMSLEDTTTVTNPGAWERGTIKLKAGTKVRVVQLEEGKAVCEVMQGSHPDTGGSMDGP